MTVRLSFSNYKIFKECPEHYRFLSSKTPSPQVDNKVNALFGSIIGTVFEQFYAWEMWKHKDPVSAVLALVPPTAESVLKSYDRPGKSKLDFSDPSANYKSPEDVVRDVSKFCVSSVDTILKNDLVGDGATAEEVLDVLYPPLDVFLVGRADFVIPSKTHGLLILDGKGSRHHDKYLDVDQLYWYAAQHYLKVGVFPDKIGFLNWRYKGDKAISWVPLTLGTLIEFFARLEDVVGQIKKASFPTKPGNACRFCPFLSLCPDGTSLANPGVYDFGDPTWQALRTE